MSLKVIDKWDDHGDLFWTVQISPTEFCDIKKPKKRSPYIMDCQDGREVYRFDTYGEGVRNLTAKELSAVMSCVREYEESAYGKRGVV